MPEPLRKIGSFLAALALVGGIIAVVAFLAALAGGDLTTRGLIGFVLGAAAIVLVPRLVPVPRLLGGFSALIYAFLFFPILVVVVYAFNSGTNVADFAGFSTKPFSRALDDESITSSITRSLQIALASAIIATVFGTAAALALSRVSRRVRNPFDVLVFLTLVVPELVIAVSSLIFFVNVGFELGLVTMFLAHTVFNASLVLLVVRARFVSMGSTHEEASMDLGAGALATFRQITLPRLAPAIVAGAMLSFTFSFDDVVISNFTAGAGNDTWPLRILAGLRFGLSPDLNAAATMMLAITLLGLGSAALLLRRAARTQGSAGLSLTGEG
ncbi:MAG: ABC transporter permease [Solirubrobacterales bacterium]|nr:ABC transporter permease [Solirubrobacterales bacterium]